MSSVWIRRLIYLAAALLVLRFADQIKTIVGGIPVAGPLARKLTG